jgi:thioredoxin-like negative regulator of GroEL
VLVASGQTENAREALNGIYEPDLTNPAVRLNYAQSLILVGDFRRSLDVIEKLPMSLQTTDALPVRAICYFQLGERVKFDALLPLAKKAAISKPVVAVKFAQVLLDAGLSKEAVELLRSAPVFSSNAASLILLAKGEIAEKTFRKPGHI